jgi:hypothetical protein
LGFSERLNYWTQKTKAVLKHAEGAPLTSNGEKEVKPIASPGVMKKDVIFEQVSGNQYLVYNRTEEKFVVRNRPWYAYEHNGVEYVPLPRLPWPAAYLPKDYETEEQLFNEIKEFFVNHLDVANQFLYDVYAAFTMASWRPEDFTVVPYQFFLGPLASGKTRALECFHRVCYRSIMAASMSAASLFRALEAWHPTLLLDETEIYKRESMVEVLALLNTGYRRGQYAIRIEKVEEGVPQVAMFDTFGFKVLAGTEELAATLHSRCILTSMSKAVREINLFIDEEQAEKLRNKLLNYRFRNLGKTLDDSIKEEFLKLNGYFQNARVIELFISLLQVAPNPEIKERLLTCMKQITQSRLDEEQASLEARVFDAVLKCEGHVDGGKISTQAITEAFNDGVPEKEQVKSTFIGRKVVALGFEKCRLSGGPSGYFWDLELIERLQKRYYPTPSESPSLPSQPSLPSLINEKEAVETPKLSEGSESKPSHQPGSEPGKNTMKSEGSERSEVSEGFLEGAPFKPEDVAKLERLTSNVQDKCILCGFYGRMDWQATLHDKSWDMLCEKCGAKLAEKLGEVE